VSGRRIRLAAGLVGSGAFLLAWIFPIVWSVLNSFKTEQDVLA
jgi:multiple sugar transport system permease protein